MKVFVSFCLLGLSLTSFSQPVVSFTFDDGSVNPVAGYSGIEWNQMIVQHLKKNNIKAAFFLNGKNLSTDKGKSVIKLWNEAGNLICNHSYSHFNYTSTSFNDFSRDVARNDSVISLYSNYTKLFRFPYLREGETTDKISLMRQYLDAQGYRNGHVTIDGSDWYIDGRLKKRLVEDPKADIEPFRKFYVSHLIDRARFYEKLAFELTGRHIKHTLLLHDNLTSAFFLGDLIAAFKKEGWKLINAGDAYTDQIFSSQPTNVPAGESLTWALAKESGKFESILHYPAEDGDYLRDEMDRLGL